MRRFLCGFVIAFALAVPSAAVAAPLAGTVLDATTLEPIEGATVTPLDREGAAPATTGPAGRYRFADLPPGPLKVRIAADGYEPSDEQVDLPEAGSTDVVFVLLRPGEAGEIIEITEWAPEIIEEPGQIPLAREEITRMPGTRGDALQSIKSLPGVANADAPGAGPGLIVIRGAAPEDSKITIDGIEVPLVYHFFGLQSVLPSELIQTIDFLPGGFDAREGRSTGGIIDIVTRSEPADEMTGFVETSFINFAALLQGPISRSENVYFTAGVRRGLIDLVLPAVIPDDVNLSFTTAPQYYDGQFRVDWRPNSRHQLSSLSLASFDLLSLVNEEINPNEPLLTGKFDNEVSFTRMINSWRYTHGDLQSKMTLAGGTTGFRAEIGAERYIRGDERRLELREDLRYQIADELALRAGAEGRLSEVDIEVKLPLPPAEGSGNVPNFSTSPVVEQMETFGNHVAGLYLIADIFPTDKTRISPGLRFDYYHRMSASTLHPRLSVRHEITPRWTALASIGSYSRNLQQNEALPTYLDPEIATQYVAGVEHTIRPGITASASGFYTDRRQLVVQDAMLAASDPENAYVNRGYGRSFGAEALVRAKSRDFFGWIAYTLSRSDRVDSPLGDRRLFDFDQTHVFIAVASYRYGGWNFGGRFTYSTGNPQTPIEGSIYQSDFNVYLPVLGDINSDRLDASHQLDLRVDRKWTFDSWQLSAYLDVTNVYANPRTLGFRYNFDYSEREAIEELPLVPALGVRGSF
jgi:hypothetical protein